jgi:hypothetical protein
MPISSWAASSGSSWTVARRRSGARTIICGLFAVAAITVLGAAEALLRHPLGQVAAMVGLPIAAYLLGRRSGRRSVARAGTSLATELAALRSQVAELEDAARRPLAAILASYRRIQSNYQDGGNRS